MMKYLRNFVICLAVAGTAMAQTSASGQASSTTTGNVNAAGQSATGEANSTTSGAVNATGQSATGQATSTTSGAVTGQSASAAAQSQQQVQAVLSKSIDANKAKQGDAVEAKTTQALKGAGGVEIPKGSKLIGHVTEAKARNKESQESALGIAFDQAVLKNGQTVPFHASILAVSAAQATAAADSNMGMDSPNPPSTSGSRPMGGLGSTVGGVARGAANTAGGVASEAGSAVGDVGRTAGGAVNPTTGVNAGASSTGVMGLPGVKLDAQASNQANGSVFTSSSHNVKLDSGTTLVLRVMP
jgi:hypothetical protein